MKANPHFPFFFSFCLYFFILFSYLPTYLPSFLPEYPLSRLIFSDYIIRNQKSQNQFILLFSLFILIKLRLPYFDGCKVVFSLLPDGQIYDHLT